MNKNLIPLILANELDGVPEWFRLFPWGFVKSTKGDFFVTRESADLIINTFRERGNDTVIDYEHQTLDGGQAPAAGWIKDYEAREDGIWAKAEWTGNASQYILNKEYRYFSPVIYTRKNDKVLVAVKNVALTNDPAMANVLPIVLKNLNQSNSLKEEKLMLKKLAEILGIESPEEPKILEAVKALKAAPPANNLKDINIILGIKEDAEAAEALTSLKALKSKQTDPATAHAEVLSLLDLKDTATLAEVKGRVIALKNPDGYVSKEDFISLKDKLDQRDRNELVSMALSNGKITPAQKDWAEKYALKDPEGFKAFVDQAPVVVPLDQINLTRTEKTAIPDDVQLSINKQLGIEQELVDKYNQ